MTSALVPLASNDLLYRAFEIRFNSHTAEAVGKLHNVRWEGFQGIERNDAACFAGMFATLKANYVIELICDIKTILDPQAFDFVLSHLAHRV
jgi:hypothetical protein